ncbi:MAG: META domain-containing protein [Bacteroidales bacterium]
MKLVTLLLLVTMVGCGMGRKVLPEDIMGKEWTLQKCEVSGKEVAMGHEAPVLMFNDTVKIAGSTGCNRIIGDYKLHGDSLTVNIIGTTRMACPDMDFEYNYLNVMKFPMKIIVTDKGTVMELENNEQLIKLIYKVSEKR